MPSLKKLTNVTGLLVFAITFFVFYHSVERTGSLWDCGEFILGAYKLQVVHPPGAGLFLIIGRIFAWVATILSDKPSDIAFAVNLMSALCTSVAAVMIAWVTIMFGKVALVGKDEDTSGAQNLALAFAGLVAGLTTAFSTSVWFSAVEGEVYAMSTMFTAITLWAGTKYYTIQDENMANRWLVLSLFVSGMSVGVHLLSILSLPAIALLVYFKKYEKHTFLGSIAAMAIGVAAIVFVLKFVIVGIPTLWKNMELLCVNGLGLPFHSGIIPTLAIIGALSYAALRYAHKKGNQLVQIAAMSAILIVIAFSTVGVVVIRANTDTPINMNVPSDAMRLLPYLNREQYGERPLLSGPHYDAEPIDVTRSDRYGRVGDKYQVVDEKFDYVYAPKDKILFPRIGHTDAGRPDLHRMWREQLNGSSEGKPGMGYNLQFLFHYQLGWMYVRYFMWNFVGRQTAEQGYYPWDLSKGHWMSGIKALDEQQLYKMDTMPDTMKNDESRNTYFYLPFIFGLLGLVFQYSRSSKEFTTLLILFVITGVGIIIYSNQPPNEPRERDYVLVGSFMTFCIWIGMGVLSIYQFLSRKVQHSGVAVLAGLTVLSAPVIMGTQNFDDHSRKHHMASRDYAANFLNSVQPNAIIFTYGDNDTYPLWYAQEVEGIRRDVRVVNLSLIAVDWYINKLRSKVNDSPPIKLTLSEPDYRGKNCNQVFFANPDPADMARPVNIFQAFRYIKDPQSVFNGSNTVFTRNFLLPVDREKYAKLGLESKIDSSEWVDNIEFRFPENSGYIIKDELAVMDVIASNFYDRPIYFAITCQSSKLLGLNDYVEMEGLGLRITPTKVRKRSNLPSIYGFGDIDTEKVYENVMKKWAWGNFDKQKLFVDKSYLAEVQAMKLVMLRASMELGNQGEMEKAKAMANKYFEAFPHMNFPYDASVMGFIDVLIEAKDLTSAKKHLSILAEENRQYLEFYRSQTDEGVIRNFMSDEEYRINLIQDLLERAGKMGDAAYLADMEKKFSSFKPKNEPKIEQ